MRPLALILCLAAMPALATPSFNVDFGRTDLLAPSPLHGGAARQPGFWNVVTNLDADPQQLVDVEGASTDVTIAFNLPFGPASFDHPETGIDQGGLLDDYLDLHSTPVTMEILGLPKGTYRIVVYGWAPDSPDFTTLVVTNGNHVERLGGKWPGDYRRGVTHAVFNRHVDGTEPLTVQMFGLRSGTLNGLQITGLSSNP